MKNLTISGRLGRDAELRRTQDGKPVAGFSVAVDDRMKKDAPTLWVRCSIWGKRGEALCPHLTKGKEVTATGNMSLSEYNGKTSVELDVQDLDMHGGKSDGQSQGQQQPQTNRYDQASTGGGYGGGIDDDIPFAAEFR